VKESAYKRLSILLVLSAVALSVGASVVTPTPLGSDVFYHLEVAYEWARGENAFLSPFVLSHAHTPYPPLFHWLLVPSVWLGIDYLFCRFLQVVFMAGTIGLTMWFAHKYTNYKTTLFTGLFLMSSIPFMDSIMQVRPQSVTMLLLPLILYYFIERKSLGFVTTFLVTVYSWSVSPLFFLYGLVVARLRDRSWLKNTLVIISLVAVLGLLILHYSDLSLMFGRWGGHWDSTQERLLWEQPLTMFFTYLGTSWVGIPILGWNLYKWKNQPTYIKTICMVLVSSLVLFPLWTDRWFQISSILLSILSAKWLTERKGFWYGTIITYVILVFAFWQIFYWTATFTGAWYTAGSNQWWNAP
jgi:hypothetical protein